MRVSSEVQKRTLTTQHIREQALLSLIYMSVSHIHVSEFLDMLVLGCMCVCVHAERGRERKREGGSCCSITCPCFLPPGCSPV